MTLKNKKIEKKKEKRKEKIKEILVFNNFRPEANRA